MTDTLSPKPSRLASGVDGQRVVVTAGASGIGAAIAETLLEAGARVFICDVDTAALAAFKGAHPGVLSLEADVSSDAQVDRLFAAAGEAFDGALDALVNNAGIAGPTGGVDQIDPAAWRRCIDIDLTGQFLCTRLAVPMLRKAGGGAIVNMSSAAGRHGYAYRTPYAAAKWGVIGFTQSLAKELGPENIRVNAILPGVVAGPRIEKVISARAEQLGLSHEAMTEKYLSTVSLRRMVSPYDIADMTAFLLSEAGRNISGQSLSVDGNVETL